MRIGSILIAIAVCHVVVGILLYRDVLAEMFADGFVASVADRGDRATTLWFIVTGLAVGIVGLCVRAFESHGLPLPSALPLSLVVLAASVVIPMPNSGGWLFLPAAWLCYRRSQRSIPAAEAITGRGTKPSV